MHESEWRAQVLSASAPAASYVVTPDWPKNWLAPMYLPTRFIDRAICARFGLLRCTETAIRSHPHCLYLGCGVVLAQGIMSVFPAQLAHVLGTRQCKLPAGLVSPGAVLTVPSHCARMQARQAGRCSSCARVHCMRSALVCLVPAPTHGPACMDGQRIRKHAGAPSNTRLQGNKGVWVHSTVYYLPHCKQAQAWARLLLNLDVNRVAQAKGASGRKRWYCEGGLADCGHASVSVCCVP